VRTETMRVRLPNNAKGTTATYQFGLVSCGFGLY
jgi:hypothetical protein